MILLLAATFAIVIPTIILTIIWCVITVFMHRDKLEMVGKLDANSVEDQEFLEREMSNHPLWNMSEAIGYWAFWYITIPGSAIDFVRKERKG